MPILAAIPAFAMQGAKAAFNFLKGASAWQILCLIAGVVIIYQHFEIVSARHDAARWHTQFTKLQSNFNTQSARMKARDATLVQLSNQLRKQSDEENSRIAGDAGSLRVSGPGKSACRPASPASPSQSQPSNAEPNVAGPALPTDDRAGVPWGWLTDRAQEHDQLRSEVQSWRDWYANLVKNWPGK